jgi:hypothetical protein
MASESCIGRIAALGYLNFPPFSYEDQNQVVQGSLAEIVKNVIFRANMSLSSFQYLNRCTYKMVEDGNLILL